MVHELTSSYESEGDCMTFDGLRTKKQQKHAETSTYARAIKATTPNTRTDVLRCVTFVALAGALTACGGGGGGTATLPNPTPSSGSSNAVLLSPSSLSFTESGTAAAQTTHVSEAQYSGNFTATSANCAGIATIAAGTSAGSFTITPAAGGSCSFTITDANGKSATLRIGVTTSSVGVQ